MEQNKTVRVSFNELAKSVTAEVKVEATGENIDNNEILKEAKALFDEAHSYAKNKTMQKAL